MLKDEDRIFKNLYNDFGWDISSAVNRGDWLNTKEIISKGKDWIINEIKDSQLRGRGGAGFPAGRKWRSLCDQKEKIRYVVLNADEGEPGTFKDREIIMRRPDKVLEGLAISAYTVGAKDILNSTNSSNLMLYQNSIRNDIENKDKSTKIDTGGALLISILFLGYLFANGWSPKSTTFFIGSWLQILQIIFILNLEKEYSLYVLYRY